jgi:hypothetical protein
VIKQQLARLRLKFRKLGFDSGYRDKYGKKPKIKDKPCRQILLATDCSEAAGNAAYLGIKFARQYGAKIYIVYVTNVTAYDSNLMDESWVMEECEECEKRVI